MSTVRMRILHCQDFVFLLTDEDRLPVAVGGYVVLRFSLSWPIFFLLVDSPAPVLRNLDRQDAIS